jgi:hypothetical protein
VQHPVEIRALGNNAQILVHGQYFGCARSKNCLRIGKDNLVHFVASSAALTKRFGRRRFWFPPRQGIAAQAQKSPSASWQQYRQKANKSCECRFLQQFVKARIPFVTTSN